jgi:hypothetical protein
MPRGNRRVRRQGSYRKRPGAAGPRCTCVVRSAGRHTLAGHQRQPLAPTPPQPPTAAAEIPTNTDPRQAADRTGMNALEIGCCTACSGKLYAYSGSCGARAWGLGLGRRPSPASSGGGRARGGPASPSLRWLLIFEGGGFQVPRPGPRHSRHAAGACVAPSPSPASAATPQHCLPFPSPRPLAVATCPDGTYAYGGACVTPTITCTGSSELTLARALRALGFVGDGCPGAAASALLLLRRQWLAFARAAGAPAPVCRPPSLVWLDSVVGRHAFNPQLLNPNLLLPPPPPTPAAAATKLVCTDTSTGKVRTYAITAVQLADPQAVVGSWGPAMPWCARLLHAERGMPVGCCSVPIWGLRVALLPTSHLPRVDGRERPRDPIKQNPSNEPAPLRPPRAGTQVLAGGWRGQRRGCAGVGARSRRQGRRPRRRRRGPCRAVRSRRLSRILQDAHVSPARPGALSAARPAGGRPGCLAGPLCAPHVRTRA